MSRIKLQAAEVIDLAATDVIAQDAQAATALGVIQTETNQAAQALSVKLGYEGSLTVGALEDHIRFYQRRTVEALLETGKALLVLKELTPYGEFSQRVELLGITAKTAQRFMAAASKTSKSDKLSLLSTHVKNASAFLELITHDDDVLENLAQMDDIDRMPASELRKAVRELKENYNAKGEQIADKDLEISKLKTKLSKQKLADFVPDEAAQALLLEINKASTKAEGEIASTMRKGFQLVKDHTDEHGGTFNEVLSGYLLHVEAACQALREEFGIKRQLDDIPAWLAAASSADAADVRVQ